MNATPRQRRTIAVVIGAVLLLALLGGCGVWLTKKDPVPHPGALRLVESSGAAEAQSPPGHAPFAAVGSVSQLHPGQLQTLQVKVTNPDSVDYRILELTATPRDARPSATVPGSRV